MRIPWVAHWEEAGVWEENLEACLKEEALRRRGRL